MRPITCTARATFYDFPVTSWPDSDPLVTGVGGTELHLDGVGNRTAPDSVWNETYDSTADGFFYGFTGSPLASGGGKSVIFERPSFQDGVAKVVGQHRGVPDISMSAACDGGVNTYQSFPGGGRGWSPDVWHERGYAAVRRRRRPGRPVGRPPAWASSTRRSMRCRLSMRPGSST